MTRLLAFGLFFSSRRRHTRCLSDWSSDVCSSDLFLRHIERTKVLVHLVDVSDASGRPDAVQDFKVINNELASFYNGSDENLLADKPMIVCATKIDAANPEKLNKGASGR